MPKPSANSCAFVSLELAKELDTDKTNDNKYISNTERLLSSIGRNTS